MKTMATTQKLKTYAVAVFQTVLDELPEGTEQPIERTLKEQALNRAVACENFLQGLKRGGGPYACWCECGIDNPNMKGQHSDLCIRITEHFKAMQNGVNLYGPAV